VLFISKESQSFLLLSDVIAVVVAFVVGVGTSRKLHRTRREMFAARLAKRETIEKLEAALAEVGTLEGILPICASCKKIRQEDGDWTVLEKYISERSESRFSHGVCPECMAKLYPEYPRRPTDA
jgi:hypothetical protein